MNLRELAEQDLAITLEDGENGGASPFTFYDKEGTGHALYGTCGDIGYLLDEEGVPVQGRSIVNTFRLSSLSALTPDLPVKGSKVVQADLSGKEWILYVVRFEPDRTLGVGRLVLALDLS